MANPLLQGNYNNNNNSPLGTLMGLIQSGRNPQQIMQMMNGNPQLQAGLQQFNNMMVQMQQSGNPKQFVMQFAKQQNVNIEPMLAMLQQMGVRL